ncbi:MAG TPA: tRNA (adenosine(37)-N6)-threonylcarbamoyltransferase complex ATPase subunit type 1 TsaE [Burkholderiaceae bacterium]|nr:tRNA (adenosine(37)-N6)-threonylcarbamoyltransferase complex ATPase subunit type 1 TsaE [Burkholderiaceae bacterium]
MHSQILETPVLASTRQAWLDEAACEAAAARLASLPALRQACIELEGPLGAGKTTFVRHLLRALGVTGRIKSPSYTIVEPYEPAGLPAWHFDFYRFGDPRELEEAGLRELFAAPGLKLVEWPQRARDWLPVPDLRLVIEPQPDGSRAVVLQAFTPRGKELLA